ncbi:hypothetical protein COW36_05465 [bacterium (Candidatus Blackallbacteria) CG17_big_fil_post_rev_8_21_14_2_50_48_46]|uniref:Lon N-terminal domain-containing protein n=1 Tax=bacterium (Candidatus Blackallbacteria) CG17_big_fil_post_rev_8_21_14_2_50_48_46 TaxID=2014261 RepID=A0A2M7G800_9BACT|nr:MAG: hypothetical protein COW64_21060 [bacterium (Candidatus Blackallbacteria) CG18_big_fil_WC_8_21_14_2_50_49_26]PIW18216.1 MAG: hypothetical protein COW36_05465 [bacterium (Candidatus Blackallbacteria) CG17_big_fil_post_rev_8_21_14_2_50_48_46]PIW50647.1 MAG: hypothetical protein COW20_01730 [bacterium (Candidatus Blackallbacteria) CG13_big_fil_rev_8_21_14_2_50_49_14]
MSSEILIPIFPLGIVPLPGEPVPLHIFEPRYKQMIADCAPVAGSNQYLPIGINFAHPQKLHETGCTVIVHQILHKYADGQLDIMTQGSQRFHVLELDHSRSYLQAKIRYFEDLNPSEIPDPDLKTKLLENYQTFLSLIGSDAEWSLDTDAISFQLAALLSLETEIKLELLESRSENERLERLCNYFKELLPRLEKAKEFQRRVRSNGHF